MEKRVEKEVGEVSDDEDVERREISNTITKRDYLGLPRLDEFEIKSLPICKMHYKDWQKSITNANEKTSLSVEEFEVSI